MGPVAGPSAVAGAALSGQVHGGQSPVSGAHVYLMAASTGGYGSAAVSLLTKGDGSNSTRDIGEPLGYYVNTGSDGSFLVTGDYTCTTGQMLYLLSTGGNPGIEGTGINNSAIALVSPLGLCQNISSATRIQVNEATTVAMAYAFSGFMSSPKQFASSGTTAAITGMTNALTTFKNLVNNTNYTVLATTPNGGVAPQQTVDTLANVLAVCVNTSLSTSTACNTLLTTATSTGTSGGTAAPETFTAAHNIGRYPYANVHALFQTVLATGPFQPALSSEPAELALRIVWDNFAYYNITAMCSDGLGNVWSVDGGGYMEKATPDGTTVSPAGGYVGTTGYGYYCAINPSTGHLEMAGNGMVNVFDTATGALLQTFSGAQPDTGYVSATRIAINNAGDTWVADQSGQTLGGYNASGTPYTSAAGYVEGRDGGVAFDSAGNLWDVNYAVNTTGTSEIQKIRTSDGSALTTYTLVPTLTYALAMDSSDSMWTLDSPDNTVVQISKTGGAISPTGGYSGYGLANPLAIEIDGAGTAWITGNGNASNTALTGFTSTGAPVAPTNGYVVPDSANAQMSVTVDLSGNVWTAYEESTSGDGFLTEFVGLGTPVYRPLTPGKAGTRP